MRSSKEDDVSKEVYTAAWNWRVAEEKAETEICAKL